MKAAAATTATAIIAGPERDGGGRLVNREAVFNEVLNALMFQPSVYTVAQACEFVGVSEQAFYGWVAQDNANVDALTRARANWTRRVADRLMELGQTCTNKNWAAHKLESENLRWLLSKFNPAAFGDKLELAVTKPKTVSAEPIKADEWEAAYGVTTIEGEVVK